MALGDVGQCSRKPNNPAFGVRNAPGLIDESSSIRWPASHPGALWDGPGGADLGAEIAAVFAITQAGDQAGGVETVQPRFPPDRLQSPVGQTLKH